MIAPRNERIVVYRLLLILILVASPAALPAQDIPAERMRQVYEEVKTPFKYGVVIRGEDHKPVDCPSVFRCDTKWYMIYVCMNRVGYETHLAESADLLSWKPLGKIMSFRQQGWDAWQADGGVALCDPAWGGSCELQSYDGKYTSKEFPPPPVVKRIPPGCLDAVHVADDDAWEPQGDKTSTGGGPEGKVYRHALPGGWFSWKLAVQPGRANRLVCTYWGGDPDRAFDILIDGAVLATQTVIAEVNLNGQDLGILWNPPFRADVTKIARPGANDLEVRVTNLWPIRLIGDEQYPDDCSLDGKWTSGGIRARPEWLLRGEPRPEPRRVTFAAFKHWNKDDRLLPSGLLGPVTVVTAIERDLAPCSDGKRGEAYVIITERE